MIGLATYFHIHHFVIVPSRSLALAKLIVGCCLSGQLCKQSYMINRIGYRNLGSRVGDGYNGDSLTTNPPFIIISRIVGQRHLVEVFAAIGNILNIHSRGVVLHVVTGKMWYKIVNRIVAHKEVQSVVAHSTLVFLWTYALKRQVHPVEVVFLFIRSKSFKASYLHYSVFVGTEVVAQLSNQYIERQIAILYCYKA